jgi:hypothetical protein
MIEHGIENRQREKERVHKHNWNEKKKKKEKKNEEEETRVHGTDEKLELKSEPRNQKINDKK